MNFPTFPDVSTVDCRDELLSIALFTRCSAFTRPRPRRTCGHVLRKPKVLRYKYIVIKKQEATGNKCIDTSNKCLTSSNKKLLEIRIIYRANCFKNTGGDGMSWS